MFKTTPLLVPPLRTQPLASGAAGGAGAPPQPSVLPPFMQTQLQSNWCWSANGTSIGLLFQTGPWTQCNTACGCLNRTDCCATPCPALCNVYGYLDQSLQFTRSFDSMVVGPATALQIRTKILMGLPICARVAWHGGGAHFLAITGFDQPGDDPNDLRLYLQDPWFGSSTIRLADFAAQYHGGGDWTHTYYTLSANPVYSTMGILRTPPLPAGGAALIEGHFRALSDPRGENMAIPSPNLRIGQGYQVYSVGVKSLAEGTLTSSASRGPARYMVLDGNRPLAEADLLEGGNARVRVAAMHEDKHAQSTGRAFETMVQLLPPDANDYEVRVLESPGVHFSALWLVRPGGDLFIPLDVGQTPLAPNHPYSEQEVVATLREEARTILMMQDKYPGPSGG